MGTTQLPPKSYKNEEPDFLGATQPPPKKVIVPKKRSYNFLGTTQPLGLHQKSYSSKKRNYNFLGTTQPLGLHQKVIVPKKRNYSLLGATQPPPKRVIVQKKEL